MRPLQGSDSTARPVTANQTAESYETTKPMETTQQGSESKVQNSATEAKSAQQMGQQNKATKNMEGSVLQQELHSSLPGDVILAQGKPPAHLTDGSSGETSGASESKPSKMRGTVKPDKLVMAENGVAIIKKGRDHVVFGENKDRIQGNPKDGVNGVYVEDNAGKPQVIIFDKNGKDGGFHRFTPIKFTPQQIVRMWEEERKANPKATNEEINALVLKRRDEK